LGKITAIIAMIKTSLTQKLAGDSLMQGHAGMTIGLENIQTVGTLQGLTIDLVLTTRTGNHDR